MLKQTWNMLKQTGTIQTWNMLKRTGTIQTWNMLKQTGTIQTALALALALAALSLAGAEAPRLTAPRPIPADRQEKISQQMIILQAKQMEALKIASAARDAVIRANQAQAELSTAETEFRDNVIRPLQKEFGAEGCDLKADKTWECPKEPAAAASKKD